MNKKEIKSILISMRTKDNESQVNRLLGKIDLLSDEEIETKVAQIGASEEEIRNYLQEKLREDLEHRNSEHTPINEMFSYGVTKGSIHLHMSIDLHQMIAENGRLKTLKIVNLQLLDAIERIRKLQKDGFYRFKEKDSIYMISPILIGIEQAFLKEMDFTTHSYKKKELQDDEFVKQHPEAQLAIQIFGKARNVGTAIISLDIINSEEWQRKREEQIKAFAEKGIRLKTEEKETRE